MTPWHAQSGCGGRGGKSDGQNTGNGAPFTYVFAGIGLIVAAAVHRHGVKDATEIWSMDSAYNGSKRHFMWS